MIQNSELIKAASLRYMIMSYPRKLMTSYVAGFQDDYRSELSNVMRLSEDQPELDDFVWRVTWDAYTRMANRLPLDRHEDEVYRPLALLTVASLVVLERLSEVGIHTDVLTTPPNFTVVAPRIFPGASFAPRDIIRVETL